MTIVRLHTLALVLSLALFGCSSDLGEDGIDEPDRESMTFDPYPTPIECATTPCGCVISTAFTCATGLTPYTCPATVHPEACSPKQFAGKVQQTCCVPCWSPVPGECQ